MLILMTVVDTTEAIFKSTEKKNIAIIWFQKELTILHNCSVNVYNAPIQLYTGFLLIKLTS